jgi:hypothetical protein
VEVCPQLSKNKGRENRVKNTKLFVEKLNIVTIMIPYSNQGLHASPLRIRLLTFGCGNFSLFGRLLKYIHFGITKINSDLCSLSQIAMSKSLDIH